MQFQLPTGLVANRGLSLQQLQFPVHLLDNISYHWLKTQFEGTMQIFQSAWSIARCNWPICTGRFPVARGRNVLVCSRNHSTDLLWNTHLLERASARGARCGSRNGHANIQLTCCLSRSLRSRCFWLPPNNPNRSKCLTHSIASQFRPTNHAPRRNNSHQRGIFYEQLGRFDVLYLIRLLVFRMGLFFGLNEGLEHRKVWIEPLNSFKMTPNTAHL
jgi:hypothetical protein